MPPLELTYGDWNQDTASSTNVDIQGDTFTLATAQPPSGVSRWEFEQTLTDSWDSNPWTDNTSAGYTTTAKYGSYAKAFDGADDYLSNADIVTETNAWTLSAWVYWAGNSRGIIYSTDEDNNAPRGFQFRVDSDGTLFVFDGNAAYNTTAAISTSTYQFVALAKAADGTFTVDVNGVRENFTGSFNDTTHSLYQGARSGANVDNPFADYIDDGRYHDKQLSDAELDELRTTGGI